MAATSNNYILPVAVAIVLGLGALWAIAQDREKEATDAEDATRSAEDANAPKPFEDMPPEKPPKGAITTSTTPSGTTPAGLEDNRIWKLALELAEEAEAHFTAATESKLAGDRSKLNAEGSRAQTLFDQALEATADWEQQLIATHGDQDPQVRAIMRRRNEWFDRTRWLHKSIGR